MRWTGAVKVCCRSTPIGEMRPEREGGAGKGDQAEHREGGGIAAAYRGERQVGVVCRSEPAQRRSYHAGDALDALHDPEEAAQLVAVGQE